MLDSLMVSQPVIRTEAALRAVGAAVAKAVELGVRVNVAVVDAAGVQAAFVRMTGAPLHSMDIATDKAYTAVSFGLPTGQWQEALAQHSAAVRQGLVLRPRFVGFGGGRPIVVEGGRIGGIGVSGGSEQQDEIIAEAGLQALGLIEDQQGG
ncbi:heme-binding protein [Comamonas testosteroni]|uniref:GlcG/HbpS family heme-binding protein n=1 Tax=Comamonas testosteroni TaxID=285 RepID=UPI0023AB3A1B|nr:heme-binding protein [Comamonas testosteroni]WEE76086.1 heme-binding protein [Comamonas testosteroni]